MPEDPLQQAARFARRVPGYRWARRRAVPRIRQSSAARAVAHRLFATQGPAVRAPAELSAGRLIAGVGTERLPVVLISMIGLQNGADDSVLDAVVEKVAELQLLSAGFRPVFLFDRPAFSTARRFGYIVELVTRSDDWQGDHAEWSEHLTVRLASMMVNYGASLIITVGPRGLDEVGCAALMSLR